MEMSVVRFVWYVGDKPKAVNRILFTAFGLQTYFDR